MQIDAQGVEKPRPLAPRIAGAGRGGVRAIARWERLDALAVAVQRPLRRAFASPAGRRAKDFLNGTWLGHPLHPAVTDVPLGSWTAALALDLLTATGRGRFDRAAQVAQQVGIAGAALSAATGLADWADTHRAQRRIGLVHAGLNTFALGLQVASVASRRRRPETARALAAAGWAAAAVAAYLGGDLVFRRGTQVDRRAWARPPKRFTPAIAEAELAPEQPTRVAVDGAAVLLVKHAGRIYALDDVCSHQGCPLSEGRLEGDAIVCGCHGSTFRLRDGAVLHGPSPYRQPTFEVRVANGLVELRSRGT